MNDLHLRLAIKAERVRWSFADLRFEDVDTRLVKPGLVELVREIAWSELTTYSATRRFLVDFEDDPDFTQWISIWYFEETRHPLALGGWLARFGVHFDDDTIRRGRVTSPFAKSKTATLVMNIISEVVAAAAYQSLARTAPEPVLGHIAQCLASDEARHAASFMAYARRQLTRSTDPDGERRAALKALWMWLGAGDAVQHPVNQMVQRVGAREDIADVLATLTVGVDAVRPRILKLVGSLVGAPLEDITDVQRLLR